LIRHRRALPALSNTALAARCLQKTGLCNDQGEDVMKQLTDRRAVLIAAGGAALVVTTKRAAAQSADFSGTVTFKGGAVIPKGRLEIFLEDTAIQDKAQRRTAKTQIESDGKSKTMAFSLAKPAGMAASPTLQIVARLEREDGWLLARGSAQVDLGSPAQVALSAVVY
jgi:uncharacterized lipoprotein YbaY